jgi:iron complex transport system substrate-binding protein
MTFFRVFIAAGFASALGLFATLGSAAPQRIVSINACTDQLLFRLADRDRIAALSVYAADPTLSIDADKVRSSGVPLIRGSAEEVLKLKPDLVLAGLWTRRATRDRLKAEGLRLEEFAPANTLEAVKAGMRRMADLLGETERGDAMLRDLEAAERSARLASRGFTALQFQRRGYTSGEGTLINDLLHVVGLGNAAAELGIRSVGPVSLESVLKTRADLLVLLDAAPAASDQGTALLYHPALLAGYPPERRIIVPANLTVCGGPAIAIALERLGEAMRRLPPR